MVANKIRKTRIDVACLDMIAKYLLYILILDFTLEGLDQIHRIYEAEESFEIIYLLVHGPLGITLFAFQIFIGTIIPLVVLGILQLYKPIESIRKKLYFGTSLLVLFGIFFMRWNVVVGGQLFSKSFYGFTSYKFGLMSSSSIGYAIMWCIIPFFILVFLLWLLPPWKKKEVELQVN